MEAGSLDPAIGGAEAPPSMGQTSALISSSFRTPDAAFAFE